MSRFRRLVTEIHRRSLWQVLGVYAVASWIIYQIVLGLYEGFGLPDWVPPTALVLLLIGLPIVLATAFVQEGAPALPGDARRATVEGLETSAATLATGKPAAPGSPATDDPRPGVGARGRLFTWSRVITAGVLAFAGLGLAATGFMGMRALGIGPAATLLSSGVLEERDMVVLAEFRNATRDPALGSVVTEALRIQLQQSRVLNVANREYLERVLTLMQRDVEAGVDAETAREIAQREGMKAVIAGEIGAVGVGYHLSARVLSAADGGVLAAFSRTARDSTVLIDAVDALARELREKAGESLRSIRADAPLAQVSTRSLAALRRYSEGEAISQQGDLIASRQALEDAIALDSTFAMAWRKLGVVAARSAVPGAEVDSYFTRAYALRDRLNERERLQVTAIYLSQVEGDREGAARTYRALLSAYPDDITAMHNLAADLTALRRGDEAREQYRRLAARPDAPAVTFENLIGSLAGQGEYQEVERWIAEAISRYPANPEFEWRRILLMGVRGEYLAAHDSAAAFGARHRGNLGSEADALLFEIGADRAMGRLREAERHLREVVDLRRRQGYDDGELWVQDQLADIATWNIGDHARARAELSQLERLLRSRSAELNYFSLANGFADAGDPARARAFVAERDSVLGPDGARLARMRTEANILQSEGEHARAVALWREADAEDRCTSCPYTVNRAESFAALGQADSAAHHYREWIERDGFRMGALGASLPIALLGLAGVYEEIGQNHDAAATYARYLELMRHADPELRPQIEAARRALARLAAEGGA